MQVKVKVREKAVKEMIVTWKYFFNEVKEKLETPEKGPRTYPRKYTVWAKEDSDKIGLIFKDFIKNKATPPCSECRRMFPKYDSKVVQDKVRQKIRAENRIN